MALVLEDVTKLFPGKETPAIEGINLSVGDGEILGFVGLNGAGKTTTIRIAAGLSRPSRGSVTVDGFDLLRDKLRASRRIGWVPELFPFEPASKGVDLLAYYAGFNDITGAAARARARELFAEVGLEGAENVRLRAYSQGMKRRFGLATAMLAEPQNLLLDEVLNGLDPQGIAFVRDWVRKLRLSRKAVLLSSHLLNEVDSLADRVAFLHHGRLMGVFDRREIANRSKTSFRITIENLDEGAVGLLKEFGTVQLEGVHVTLTDLRAESQHIVKSLVQRGYNVAEFRIERQSLESHFLNLLEDEI